MNQTARNSAPRRFGAGWAAIALLCALAACGGSDDDDDDNGPPANPNPNGALTEADINAAQAALDTPLEVETPADPGMLDAGQAALDEAEKDLEPNG